jgi:hypothetical protein
MSKYARQVFQAMRPVFTDLASEIQRSLGFYKNSNPNSKLSKIIALGGGTKMRGLLKYLQQSLRIPVERPDSFKKLAISPEVSAAKFHESVSDFGIVYGLALQALDLARIESNLLPRNIARSMAWAGKAKYFVGAASILLVVSLMCFARANLDRISYNGNSEIRQKTKAVLNAARQASSKLSAEESKGPGYEKIIKKELEPFANRDVVPLLHETILSVLPNEKNNSEQAELYRAFAKGEVESILSVPRRERKQIFVTGLTVRFEDDVSVAAFDEADIIRGVGQKKKGKRKSRGRMGQSALLQMLMGTGMGTAPPQYTPQSYTQATDTTDEETETVELTTGFVVTIAGHSPYEDIAELMDPSGVENDRDKWGVITRLLHLDDIIEGGSSFELFKRTEVDHFKLRTGEVSLDGEMPAGIGLRSPRTKKGKPVEGGEEVLIDPMTKEVISRVAELDKYGKEKIDERTGNVVYKVNDHWFILDVKFIWKDAPKPAAGTAPGAGPGGALFSK